jgi:hypothetical protein
MRENVVGENPQLELRPPNPARAFFIPEAIYGVAVGTWRIGEFPAARVGPGAGIVFPLLLTMKSPPHAPVSCLTTRMQALQIPCISPA